MSNTHFPTTDALHAFINDLPDGDDAAVRAIRERDARLTKPAGSLGRLEEIAMWLGRWQGRATPRLDRVQILIFAGNHGVLAQGVSPWPAEVTTQMVANFRAGGAAINQIAAVAGAMLDVVEVAHLQATQDFTAGASMQTADFLDAVASGYDAVSPDLDLLCLGEMGIGNTTVAAALAAALFGGGGAAWVGRGTGLDEAGVANKARVVDRGLALHRDVLVDSLEAARCLGGYETASILGAVLAARRHRVPVLLDGFICTAAAAPLAHVRQDALAHCLIAHVSAEAGHRALASLLGQTPLFDLGLRLGEASGAGLAVPMVRAALACHVGMATFGEAGVSEKST